MTQWQLLRWMFGFLRPVVGVVVLASVVLCAWIGAEILAVRMTALAINRIEQIHVDPAAAGGWLAWLGAPLREVGELERAVLLLAAVSLLLALLSYCREVATAYMSMQGVFYIREAVYDKLQRVGLSFHDRLSTGELINRALSDLQNVRNFVNSSVLLTIEILLIVGGYVILLATRSPWLALLALAPAPLWVWYTVRFSRRMQPVQEAVMKAGDANIALLTENIAGVQVVKAFAMQQQEIARYGANCDLYFAAVMRRVRMYADYTPVIRAISMASHLLLFLAAGWMILRGALLAGDLLMLGAAMGAILGRLQQVSAINEQYQNAIVSARRLHEVLVAAPTVDERASLAALPPGTGAVRFEGVTFGYDPARPVLRDVSFSIPGGGVVAIVGPTGAGKTTLVQLLARLYDPQQGAIYIDGADIRTLSLEQVRREVAFVFQETYLFSDSVERNISYGRPDITDGAIEAAARLAQAHDFVDALPRGYDTPVGERGANLSGGQRQRLAIARAILTQSRILILDDATASVDGETEDLIQRGMRAVMHGRTAFVISHRIRTVQSADLVIVLEDGRVTQTGTHEELMRTDGHYRDIAAVQLHAGDEPAEAPSEPALERLSRD